MKNRTAVSLHHSSINFKRAGLISIICLIMVAGFISATAVLVQAATSSKTNSVDGFADGNTLTRTVTFTGSDFTAGALVSNVTLSANLEKVDNACGNYQSGNVFNREIYMMLESPTGTEIVLIEDILDNGGSGNGNTYFSNSIYNGVVTIVFDDSAGSRVGGPAPTTGTFRPEEPLSAFHGEDPIGDWIVTLGDNNAGEPFCFYEFTLNIDADQPPVADDQTFSVAENSPNGTAVDTVVVTDGDAGEKFTFAEVGGTGTAVFEIDASTGAISVTDSTQLDFENPALDQYTYIIEVTDSGALTDSATITINVTDANDAPTDLAVAPSAVAEHQPAGTAVGTLTTTDPDGGSHVYTLVAGSGDTDNSQFSISGTTLETAAEFDFDVQTTYNIRVQTDDQNGGTFAKPLTITITDGNDPPTDISLSSSTIQENQPISTTVGTFTATDPNADTPTYSLVSGTGDDDNGSFTIVGDELKNLAVFDFEGGQTSFNILVEADDGNGGTYTEAFVITVTDGDDAATDFSLSNDTIAESLPTGTAVGTFSATDIDGGSYTYTLVAGSGDADNGNFGIVGNELQSAIIFDYESQITHTIRIQLADGVGTVEKTFIITVQNSNENPTDISLSASNVAEHQPIGTTVGTLSATDPDSGDTHTFTFASGVGDDDNALFAIMGGALETAVELDYDVQTTRTVRIEASDGNGGTYEEAFVITIDDGNDPPTDIALDNNTITENQASGTLVGNLSATDPNGDLTISYSLPATPSDNAAFQISGSQLQSAVSFDFETKDTYNIVIEVNDGNGGTYQEPFTITIVDDFDAPTAIAVTPNAVLENQPISTTVGVLSATDQDSGAHTFTLVAGSGDTHNALFDIVGTDLKTLTTFDYETALPSYSIRVRADDGAGGLFSQIVLITVADANDDPTDIALDTLTIEENVPLASEVGAFSTTDEDSGDSHTYSLVAGAGDTHNALFQITDEYLETNALFDYETAVPTYTIRVQSDDGNGGMFTKNFILTVTDANDAPVANPDFGGTIDEDSLLTVTAGSGVLINDTDEDSGDTFSVSGFDSFSADFAVVSVASDGAFTFDPRGSAQAQALGVGQQRVDSFTYIVEDSGGMTSVGTVTVTVTGVNDDPTAVSDSAFTEESQAVIIDVITNDTDPENDALTVSGVVQSADGSVVNNGNGTVTYTPNAQFRGQDSFTYTISDGNGGTATGTVNVSVGEIKLFVPTAYANYETIPDLVVTNIEATSSEIRVEISNQGTASTSSGFWVDFYVDPNPVPTEEDQVWQDVADEGVVWGINVGLEPGESLTLVYSTAPGAPNLFYSEVNSHFSGSLPVGTAVYAHVDSAHLATSYGGVLEGHEKYGEAYNNISNMYLSTATLRPTSTNDRFTE